MASIRALVALMLVALLAGCATVPPAREVPALQGVPTAFEMSGRISIRVSDRSDIARLRWTRATGRDSWVIASPLGNEVARIESDAGGARVSGALDESAASFAQLTEKLLGIAIEPDELAAWLHGRVPQAAPDGWKVTLDETQRAGAVDLARRLTATRGDTVVRLVVDDYRATP